jgi:hypothetical protein
VSLHRGAGLGVLVAAACTPEIDPAWLVTSPRELALEVEVVAQGPYGERIVPGPRTPRDALPLDTVSLRPAVVDVDGPLDPDRLEGAWFSCSGLGNCLVREEVANRPACTGDEIQPEKPCRFADGGTASLTLASIPTVLPPELTSVFDLISGPTVAFVGSPAGGPGVDVCLARLDARERLDGCLMMERALGIGPLGELVELLDALGIDPGIDGDAVTLLAAPRNHNPAVEQLRVTYGGESRVVPAGDTITVPADEAIVLTVETSDADLDAYEVLLGEATALVSDDLSAQWSFDREVDLEEAPPGELWVRWRAGSVTGTVRAYAVLRDSRSGEAWGWLDLEIEGVDHRRR